MSEALTKSLVKGKLVIRKRKHISGQVSLTFQGGVLYLDDFSEVDLSDKISPQNIKSSNIKKLLAKDRIEIV